MDHPLSQASDDVGHPHWAGEIQRLSGTLPFQILIVALAYYVTGRLGLELAIPPGYATAVWPPSGIALSAVLLRGAGIWPGIALGSFLLNVPTGFDAGTSQTLTISLFVPAAIGGGAALQALAGAFLVRRFVGFPTGLVEVRQVVGLFGLGGTLACIINASVGVGALLLSGRLAIPNASFTWATWWAGETIGVFVFTPLAIAWFSAPREQWQKRRVAISTALAITFVIIVVLVSYTAALERNNLASDFADRTSVLPVELDKATSLHLGTVDAVQALLTSSSTVNRTQFGLFASRVRLDVPGIQALEWAPRIALTDRAAFESAMRNDGAAGFEISELTDGHLMRASERSEYFPIAYVEPLASNAPALGFDLGSQSGRLAALEAARDSGKTSVSERITLVQGGGEQGGVPGIRPRLPDGRARREHRATA